MMKKNLTFKTRKIFYEIKDLGIKRAFYRFIYEVINRTGFRKILQPAIKTINKYFYLGHYIISLKNFRREKKQFFFNNSKKLNISFIGVNKDRLNILIQLEK